MWLFWPLIFSFQNGGKQVYEGRGEKRETSHWKNHSRIC